MNANREKRPWHNQPRKRCARLPARAGFTLIETVMAASIGVVLSAIAVALIVASLASYARNRDHYEDSLILGQLAAQLRADARAASAAALAGKPRPETAIDLQMAPQERVAYAIEPSADGGAGCVIRRTRYRQDAIVGRDCFELQYVGAGSFAVDTPDDEKPAGASAPANVASTAPRLVRLRLARQSPTRAWADRDGGSARELMLQGLVGQDRRFESEER
jgi:prepilin-type N-terminal cleavage/methylation domain-containing protein